MSCGRAAAGTDGFDGLFRRFRSNILIQGS